VYTLDSGLQPGSAGGVCLRQHYYVLPETVSFSNISVAEVPNSETVECTGYFALLGVSQSHNQNAGAGRWLDVNSDNHVGDDSAFDTAGCLDELCRMKASGELTDDESYGWLGGRLVWMVPFGWQQKGTAVDSQIQPIGRFAIDATQTFTISTNGDFKIEKLGHSSERKITGEVFTDGHQDY